MRSFLCQRQYSPQMLAHSAQARPQAILAPMPSPEATPAVPPPDQSPGQSPGQAASQFPGQFPYARYRPGQREALQAARLAFGRGKRFVVIEAPTGAGKSAIAVTLGREADSAFVLTAQKLLQDQYLRDFPDLALMKGRANYQCLVEDTHAGAAPCLAGQRFDACGDCSYFLAKADAMAAQVAVMNYAYYLAELNHAGGFGSRDLLVLDEAHNSEESLMRFVEVYVSQQSLARLGIDVTLPASDFAAQREYVLDLLPVLVATKAKILLEAAENQRQSENLGADAAQPALTWINHLLLAGHEIDMLLKRLAMLEQYGADWVCEAISEGLTVTALRFRPIRVAHFAEQYLFRHAKRVLLLSATILDAETFLRALGVDPKEASFIRVPSSFPVKNRPIYPLNVARLNRDSLEAELPRVAGVIAKLLDHHDEKGIIHAHSYQILRFLLDHWPAQHRERLVFHQKAQDREDALARHLAAPNGTVLLTPSMTEGIDLAGDLARWQVIIKVPYPYLGDPQVAARRLQDPAWYEWRTALRLVQAYGRVVRSSEDFATTYVLDAHFRAWVGRSRKCLPPWFLEAIAPDQPSAP
jgi:ATP-dependent DNA helicase DinG